MERVRASEIDGGRERERVGLTRVGGGGGGDLCVVTQGDTDTEENRALPEPWPGGDGSPRRARQAEQADGASERQTETQGWKRKRLKDTGRERNWPADRTVVCSNKSLEVQQEETRTE